MMEAAPERVAAIVLMTPTDEHIAILRRVRDGLEDPKERIQECGPAPLVKELEEAGFLQYSRVPDLGWMLTDAGEALYQMGAQIFTRYPRRAPADWDGQQWLREKRGEQSVPGWESAERTEGEMKLPPPWARAMWEMFDAWRGAGTDPTSQNKEAQMMWRLADALAEEVRRSERNAIADAVLARSGVPGLDQPDTSDMVLADRIREGRRDL